MDPVIEGWQRELPELANRLSGGVTNTVNQLERLELARRSPERSDKRSSRVRLTRQGTEAAEEITRAWAAVQQQMFSSANPQLARQDPAHCAASCWPSGPGAESP